MHPRQHPAPPNRVINEFKPSQMIIRSNEDRRPFEGASSKEIVDRINRTLRQIDAMSAGKKIEVKGAAILPSGSVKLYTATRSEANWLLENRCQWSTLADPKLVTSPPVYPIVIDSVPMDQYPNTMQIGLVLTEHNPIPPESLHSIRWLSKPTVPGQQNGSVIVNLLDKELAQRMVKGMVYYEWNCLRVRACKKTRIQCHQCQEPGHIAAHCKDRIHCKFYGNDHDSRECPEPKDSPPHCIRCIE
ncbi:hypothetical protein CROQUDRAFT_51916 [Cronartium quercuum f. sp. fusiforme G11]|uniref:CCHC-type domain-containing protein n=1 Tax=Cronartium quercuum f. sp. fusiforme G11 TaxID=708437 RepID=A0A9P6T6X3_9BASI|nr:hypothetical protein CROQUDRAFT_51916 [Cronartium quercuum f. sp. fusiforme G11]